MEMQGDDYAGYPAETELSDRLVSGDDSFDAGAKRSRRSSDSDSPFPSWLSAVALGVAVVAMIMSAVAISGAATARYDGSEQKEASLADQQHVSRVQKAGALVVGDPFCNNPVTRLRCLALVESVERMSLKNMSDGLDSRANLVDAVQDGSLAVGDTHVLVAVGGKSGSPGVIGPNDKPLDNEYAVSLVAPAYDHSLCSYIYGDICLAHYYHPGTDSYGLAVIMLDHSLADAKHRTRRMYYDGTAGGMAGAAGAGAISGAAGGAAVGAMAAGAGALAGAGTGALGGAVSGAVSYGIDHIHMGSPPDGRLQ